MAKQYVPSSPRKSHKSASSRGKSVRAPRLGKRSGGRATAVKKAGVKARARGAAEGLRARPTARDGFQNYEANFISVLPLLRSFDAIEADIAAAGNGGATQASAGQIASIEWHMLQGDTQFRAGHYSAAGEEFRTARALIYQILYPPFDVPPFICGLDIALPLSAAIERDLMTVSAKMADSIRPLGSDSRPVWSQSSVAIPETLLPFTTTGFREALGKEQTLELAGAQGVALMMENKPEAAIDVMQGALTAAATGPGTVDPTMTAALELNVAAAYLQRDDHRQATTFAQNALRRFQAARDLVGQAQAQHLLALSARKAGDTAKSDELLTQAQNTLRLASLPPGPILREPLPRGAAGQTCISGDYSASTSDSSQHRAAARGHRCAPARSAERDREQRDRIVHLARPGSERRLGLDCIHGRRPETTAGEALEIGHPRRTEDGVLQYRRRCGAHVCQPNERSLLPASGGEESQRAGLHFDRSHLDRGLARAPLRLRPAGEDWRLLP